MEVFAFVAAYCDEPLREAIAAQESDLIAALVFNRDGYEFGRANGVNVNGDGYEFVTGTDARDFANRALIFTIHAAESIAKNNGAGNLRLREVELVVRY